MVKVTQELLDKLVTLTESLIDENGNEMPNPAPMEIPVGMKRPPTLQEQIQRVMRSELSQRAMEEGFETYEESIDFDVTDEFETSEPDSQYTVVEEEFVEPAKPSMENEPPPEVPAEPVDVPKAETAGE